VHGLGVHYIALYDAEAIVREIELRGRPSEGDNSMAGVKGLSDKGLPGAARRAKNSQLHKNDESME
jgi:hypothetical protein